MSALAQSPLRHRLLNEAEHMERRLGVTQLPHLLREAAAALQDQPTGEEMSTRCAQLEAEIAALRQRPAAAVADVIAQMNRALADAFPQDPANAVRAHAAIFPVLRTLTATPIP